VKIPTQTHFSQEKNFFLYLLPCFTLWTWKKWVGGNFMEMEEENENQWDPFEDEDLFIGEEESEEF